MNSQTNILFCLLIWIISSCNCYAQSTRDSVPLVVTSIEGHNLKDSVKEVQVSLQHNYPDSISFEQQKEYELLNFWQVNELLRGCEKFNPQGFLTYSKVGYTDSTLHFMPIDVRKNEKYKYGFNLYDFAIKNKIIGQYKYPFPIFSGSKLTVNHFFISYLKQEKDELATDTLSKSYLYKLENNRVFEEKYFLGDNFLIRKEYSYDGKGRVVRQDMKFKEDLPESIRIFETVDLNSWIEVSIDSKAYYAYGYDNENRETLATLVVNEDTLWREQYYYKGDSWHPYKLKRFVIAGRTYWKQLTNHSLEWYNEYGDITKSENYDDDGNLVKTRFYDYTYDSHHNWIECKMYLEGGTERTPIPTIVADRKITYWNENNIENN